MIKTIVRLLVVAVIRGNECWGRPNHCFCYKWEGLVRTDCVRKNLFNTFVGFSHQTQVLDLSHNVITILHGNEFLHSKEDVPVSSYRNLCLNLLKDDANLWQLQDLRLSNNRLHKIDKLSFNGLKLLENLDLSFNHIEHLNPSTFKYNPYLQTLNVSFNPLSLKKSEPFLSSASALRVLDMANCRLEFVSLQSFFDLKHLTVLNISRNNIQTIEIEFLNEMKNLRYLDISKNALLCNDPTLLQILERRKIQSQAFCQTNQKILMLPDMEAKETKSLEAEVRHGGDNENVTERGIQRSFFNDVVQFSQSIPSFYAIVCGIQVGIFIGSLSTYFCLRKSIRDHRMNLDQEAPAGQMRHENEDCHDMSFAEISLGRPPGTPPSPYYSRFLRPGFSFSAI